MVGRLSRPNEMPTKIQIKKNGTHAANATVQRLISLGRMALNLPQLPSSLALLTEETCAFAEGLWRWNPVRAKVSE